jgi:AcrR family transcriptional regulator
MGRPNQSQARRAQLTPILAAAFAELGYRRATTAAIAQRCGVAENQLYRLWPDKKAMFLAAIDHVFESTVADWAQVLEKHPDDPAPHILAHDARHRGQAHLHRITFAGLSESDDPDIRDALAQMYRRFHRFVADHVRTHRQKNQRDPDHPDAALTAWSIIGLGTLTNIALELDLLGTDRRRALMNQVGLFLLEGNAPGE